MQAARLTVGDSVVELARGDALDLAVDGIVGPVDDSPGASRCPAGGRRVVALERPAPDEHAPGLSETDRTESALLGAALDVLARAEDAGVRALAWMLTPAPTERRERHAEIVLGAVIAFLAPGARLERVVLGAEDDGTREALERELARYLAKPADGRAP